MIGNSAAAKRAEDKGPSLGLQPMFCKANNHGKLFSMLPRNMSRL